MTDFQKLAAAVAVATAEGQLAAEAQANDGGSANLDCVMLYGLKGVREATLRNAGISCRKGNRPGTFFLSAPFQGQGQRRYAGVQAQFASLNANGVDCYVHYQMD